MDNKQQNPQDNFEQYTLPFINRFNILKLSEDESHVHLAAVKQLEPQLRSLLEQLHNNKQLKIKRLSSREFSLLAAKVSAPTIDKFAGDRKGKNYHLDRSLGNNPAVQLLNMILIEAINRNVSDIHIEAFNDTAQVRFRIDGVLQKEQELPLHLFSPLIARIKVMANLNSLSQIEPQDGRIGVELLEQKIDIRVSIVPGKSGESVALRLLPEERKHYSLKALGFTPSQCHQLNRITALANGLALITGPTGSGKTTTLITLLKELNQQGIKIITIEDPVEIALPQAVQIQVEERRGLTFANLLRRILRQDPDVIMVGEIRDSETAQLAVRAALTGHLVLATLHTNDAAAAIPRLLNMGVASYLLAAVLRFIVAGRLVRKLCRHCHIPENDYLTAGKGCDQCSGGYSGRTIFAEIIAIDENLEKLISENCSSDNIRTYQKKLGQLTLADSARLLVKDGISSNSEIMKALNG